MPTLTNRMNLPTPYILGVLATLNAYSREGSKHSLTGLMKPAKAGHIERARFKQLSEDACDVTYRLIGSAVHALMEWACKNQEEAKEGDWKYGGNPDGLRLKGPVEVRYHHEIAGQPCSTKIDYYDTEDRILYDTKVTSVWGYVFDKGEWDEQLNGTRPFLIANGLPDPAVLRIIGIWRDWSKNQVRGNYPPHQISVLDKPLWPISKAEKWLNERVLAHEGAAERLPECTDKERWKGFDKKTKQQVFRRCAAYCAAYRWCSQANAQHEEDEA